MQYFLSKLSSQEVMFKILVGYSSYMIRVMNRVLQSSTYIGKVNCCAVLSVLGAALLCVFPLWPDWLRVAVYYVSLVGASFVGFILFLAVGKYMYILCSTIFQKFKECKLYFVLKTWQLIMYIKVVKKYRIYFVKNM